MKKLFSVLTGSGFGLFGFLTVLFGVLIAFFPVLPKDLALVSPDAMPFFVFHYATAQAEGLLTGSTFTPQTLYWLLFDPLTTHELGYMLDTLILALGAVYYLRGRGVHPLAAWFGGLALGLSGYTFTLFCAGHRGYFHMFSCAVWIFGLLIRCFETKQLFYFAVLGLVFAWGTPAQPDVLVLIGFVAVAYVLWLTAGTKREMLGRVATVWPRFLVSVLVLAVAGFGGIRGALTTQMASREAQIAGSSGDAAAASPAAQREKRSPQEEHKRWIFATNWSLPPEDVLEFFAPGVFGDESMQPPCPYWGRLGRPADEVFQSGRMMPNYRQHTVYIGAIPLLLALLGVVVYVSDRRKRRGAAAPAVGVRSDVPFWCGVWVVCLLFAMGRYAFVYRLFYSLPYLDYIRCPVKFVHLVELATAFLAGFGADAFLRRGEGADGVRRTLAKVSGGVAALLALLALVALVGQARIVQYVTSLGLGQVAQPLAGYAVANLLRGACIAALVAGVAFAWSRKPFERVLVFGLAALMIACAVDQAVVAQRYVKVIDVGAMYRKNAVVRAIEKRAQGQVPNAINYVTPNVWGQDWFSCSLQFNGIRDLLPTAEERDAPYGRMFVALQSDVGRLWRILNVHFVVVPRKAAEGLIRTGVIRPVMDFELGAGVVRQVQPNEKSLVLASVTDSVVGARAFSAWRGGVPLEQQADEVVRSDVPVSSAPGGESQAKGGAVRITPLGAAWGTPWRFETRLACDASATALLILNQKYEEGWEILVDGKQVPGYPADVIWMSAVVPAGKHVVVARKKRDVLPGALSVAAFVVFLAAGAGRTAKWLLGSKSATEIPA